MTASLNRSAVKSILWVEIKSCFIAPHGDERVIHVELESVREMVRLLSNATNNINQVVHKTHELNNFHAKDLEILQGEVDKIWEQTQVILQKISKL